MWRYIVSETNIKLFLPDSKRLDKHKVLAEKKVFFSPFVFVFVYFCVCICVFVFVYLWTKNSTNTKYWLKKSFSFTFFLPILSHLSSFQSLFLSFNHWSYLIIFNHKIWSRILVKNAQKSTQWCARKTCKPCKFCETCKTCKSYCCS